MADCDSGQNFAPPGHACQDQGDACQSTSKDEHCEKSVSDVVSNHSGSVKHTKHQNGLVTNLLKPADEAENGESADSGHGSSCQDCECVSALTQLTLESENSEMTHQTLEDPEGLSKDDGNEKDLPAGSFQPSDSDLDDIKYVVYESEKQMPDIIRLITKDLSEPYSIYTYRYFIHNWPKLCLLAMDGTQCVGAIVCKLDMHKKMVRRGYIAMLAVDEHYRRKKIGSTLVTKAIHAMIQDDCDEVVLETEITNKAALRLYENLGFIRDKRLFRYYLNGVDALRLKLWLR
ncbi:N-alpha-acetyltransferase 30-like [Babylonia areolata]|uniref:N-alpha-acetyltransferase 30-like n=1 Tax=Babylonia areolata TaxID=304850 RepID=UPI003FD57EBE